MKIAVYGGTFDPPHNTHLAIAKAALERGLAERVLFMPSARPPHKPRGLISPYADRLAMLKLAIQGEPRFEISEIEAERLPLPSYTVDTMAELSAARPQDSFILLIGSDSLEVLHTWMRAKELAERCQFAVYPRKGEPVSLSYLKRNWPDALAEKLYRAILADMPQTDLSSSALRLALAKSENAGKFIPKAVLEYIRARGLYAEPSTATQNGAQADGSRQHE